MHLYDQFYLTKRDIEEKPNKCEEYLKIETLEMKKGIITKCSFPHISCANQTSGRPCSYGTMFYRLLIKESQLKMNMILIMTTSSWWQQLKSSVSYLVIGLVQRLYPFKSLHSVRD